jgi:hypothetical protein
VLEEKLPGCFRLSFIVDRLRHADENFSQQSKEAQHTAPVRLWPVFVVPRRFAILTNPPFFV